MRENRMVMGFSMRFWNRFLYGLTYCFLLSVGIAFGSTIGAAVAVLSGNSIVGIHLIILPFTVAVVVLSIVIKVIVEITDWTSGANY